ncbi:MAG TPA: hypothetical protein DF699_10065 [Phycisphaerales bacterium]|nr:hypothetical protein [Phycisphaerales bacterium]
MKNQTLSLLAISLMTCGASADFYYDATGDLASPDFDGEAHLDISSVEITNDANFLYISINTQGDLDAVNWGKFVVGIDTGRNAGDNSTDPGSWNRNVDWGRGITDFIGSWTDDGGSGAGAELRSFNGASWGLTDATSLGGGDVTADDSAHASGTQILAVSLSALGLSDGDTFDFDVFSSGGGADPGVDHLSRLDQATSGWGTTSVAGKFMNYTVSIVPLPSAAFAGFIGLAGIAGVRCIKRR